MVEQPPPPIVLANGQPLHQAVNASPDDHRDSEGLALPHVFAFASIVGGASRTYWHERFDEAMRHSRENALAMRRDAYLLSLLQERKLAVSSLPWYLEVPDPQDRRQAKVRAALTQDLRGTRGLRRMILAWLESIWYGRYGVQFAWRWRREQGRRALAVKAWSPVNGDKIGYHYDGVPYVLVHAARASQLPGAVLVNTTRARALSLVGGWRDRFVIHQHEVDDADYFEAEAHDGRHGVGVRSRIYWLDFLKREYLEWVVTYLERVGLGTRLWKYDAASPKAKEAAEQAARDNSRRVNILVPVWGDGRGGFSGGVEVVEASTGGVNVLLEMVNALDQYIERYVVGQAGSSRSQASGIGNEAASEFMASTKDAIRDHDAHLLGETITGDEINPGLVSLMQRYSFPDTVPEAPGGFPVLFKFGLERTLNDQRVRTIQQVSQMGLPVRKDDVYNAAGLARPEEHDDVLEPQQQGGPGGDLASMLGGGGGMSVEGQEEGADEGALASEEDVDAFLAELLGEEGPEGGEDEEATSEDEVDTFLEELLGGGDENEPEQMARKSGSRVRQYAWERGQQTADGRYRWKGTGEHKGQYRTQKTEPGTGRTKKAESGKAVKKKATADDVTFAKDLVEKVKAGQASRGDLRELLATLTGKQLDELKRHFKVRGGGTKKTDKQAVLESHATGTDTTQPKPKVKAPPKKRLTVKERRLRVEQQQDERRRSIALRMLRDLDPATLDGLDDSQALHIWRAYFYKLRHTPEAASWLKHYDDPVRDPMCADDIRRNLADMKAWKAFHDDPDWRNATGDAWRDKKAKKAAVLRHLPQLEGLIDNLHIGDTASADSPVLQHLWHLGKIPAGVHQALAAGGLGGVFLANAPITEMDSNQDLRGVRPRGWSEGKTWDTVAGGYNRGRRQVDAGSGEGGNASLCLHEYGHAIGHILGLDDNPEWRAIHEAQFDRLIPYEQQDGPGSAAGMQEMFAELVATYYVRGEREATMAYGSEAVAYLKRSLRL